MKQHQDLGEKEAGADDNAQGQNHIARYVIGFLFDPFFLRVAVIRKNKPTWQAGLLNGIGGKIESGETAFAAMAREFQEEAGLTIFDWRHYAKCSGRNNDGSGFELDCFWTTGDPSKAKSQEAEKIEIASVDHIGQRTDTIGNLPWLIMLARDFGRGVYPPIFINASYNPAR